MKKCVKCNKDYPDDRSFCPECGSPLTVPSGGTNNTTENSGWFNSWGCIVFMIVGVIFEWSIDAIIGFVFALVGFFGGISSDNSAKRGVCIVLGVVAVIFFIVAML